VFYHDGIGTGGPLDRLTGGAFGRGIENNIRNLYRFILYNYSPADELYFFGFSRGAFTVRTLAGFMKYVGLVYKDHDYFVPDLWDCYEKSKGPSTREWERAHRKIKDKRPCPRIKFIGVWDTVGALGAPGVLGQFFNRGKYRYHDVGLNDTIENAYHALAIDERRKPFAPTLWTRPPGWKGQLEQAWFPGVHTNIGGGYDPDGLANEPLHWIVEKAAALGLEFDETYLRNYKPCFNSKLHDSMRLRYRIFRPHVRPIGDHPPDETVHQAAIDRRSLFQDYRPANLEAFVANAPTPCFAQTTRVLRGTPCEEERDPGEAMSAER
jgi:uncharacterized protein (DUF2235 family)